MPLANHDEIAVIRNAVIPSDVDIREAKQAILRILENGHVTRLTGLLAGVGTQQADERREAVHEDDIADPVRLREHPLIARRCMYIAGVTAIAELESGGVIVSHQRLDGGGGWDGRFETLQSLPFQRRGSSGSVRLVDLAVPEPRGSAYRLDRRLLNVPQQAHVLDPELLLEGLELPARVSRVAREASASFRRGLPLAAANLLGAVVEGAWMAAAHRLAPAVDPVARALSRDPFPTVADVQRRVVDAIRHSQPRRAEDLATVAALIRDIRNYAIHVDRTHDPDLDGWLDETGVITLFGTVRRHLRLLADETTIVASA